MWLNNLSKKAIRQKKNKLTKFNISSGGLGIMSYAWSSTPDWERQLTRTYWGHQTQSAIWVVVRVTRHHHPHEAEGECSMNPNKRLWDFSICSLLMNGVWGDKCSLVWRANESFKDTRRFSSKKNEETTLYVVYVIHFHLLPQKLNRENKISEVLTLKASCMFVFLLSHLTISYHRQGNC